MRLKMWCYHFFRSLPQLVFFLFFCITYMAQSIVKTLFEMMDTLIL